MGYEPLSYEAINQYNGTMSPTGTVQCDQTTAYFWRCLYHRLMSVVDFSLPEGWNKNYFKNVLFGIGFIGIIDTPDYGIIPQICTVSGYGLYLQPTKIIVAQPLVRFDGTRGTDCEIVRLTPDWRGVLDIVDHYAYEMASCYTSINAALINSRAGLLAYAKNKQAAETIKMIGEKLTAGEPLVIADKIVKSDDIGDTEPLFTQAFDPANNYISDKLLQDMTTILNEFDREIGIPVIDDKRERRIEAEVRTMIADSGSRLDVWADSLTESIADVKRVFPSINITFRTIKDEKGGAVDESDAAVYDDRVL